MDNTKKICSCVNYSPVINGGECRVCFGFKKEKKN